MMLGPSFFDNDLNIAELDGKKCERCGKVPELKTYKKNTKKGIEYTFIDRSARMDCDASVGDDQSIYVTYHKECWVKELYG